MLPRLKARIEAEGPALYRHESTLGAAATIGTDAHVYSDFANGHEGVRLLREGLLGPRDEALFMSLDGAQWIEHRQSDGWLIMMTRLNVPPSERYKAQATLPVALIPGPKAPVSLDSFLLPILQEFNGTGLKTWDPHASEYFDLNGKVVAICADQPASAKVSKLTGSKGHRGCRCCTIMAAYAPKTRQPYFPLVTPTLPGQGQEQDEINTMRPRHYDPMALQLRTHEEYLREVDAVETESDKTVHRILQREYGVSGKPLFAQQPAFRFPFAFPIDLFHLSGLNLPTLIVRTLREGREGDPYTIPPTIWEEFGRTVAGAARGLPSSFSSRTARDPALFANTGYRASEWALVTYLYLPAFLLHTGAPDSVQQLLFHLRRGFSLAYSDGLTAAQVLMMHTHFATFAADWEKEFVRGTFEGLNRAT